MLKALSVDVHAIVAPKKLRFFLEHVVLVSHEKKATIAPMFTCINPNCVKLQEKLKSDTEGCLSSGTVFSVCVCVCVSRFS